MYKTKVNSGKEFEISFEDGDFVLDGKKGSWDVKKIRPNHYHVIQNNKSYSIEVVKADAATKHFTIKINNKPVDIAIQDRYDLLLHKLGMDTMHTTKVNDIKAPMPGMVLKVVVNEGQEIRKGESVLILEAMKMENILKSPGDGKIKQLKVKAGDKVEKNQVLVVME